MGSPWGRGITGRPEEDDAVDTRIGDGYEPWTRQRSVFKNARSHGLTLGSWDYWTTRGLEEDDATNTRIRDRDEPWTRHRSGSACRAEARSLGRWDASPGAVTGEDDGDGIRGVADYVPKPLSWFTGIEAPTSWGLGRKR
jgi:hypothetical protein